MSIKNAVLASAVASLFLSGAAFAKDKMDKKTGSTVKCEGDHDVQGTRLVQERETTRCKGQNGCKGQGTTADHLEGLARPKAGKVATAQESKGSGARMGLARKDPGTRRRASPEALRALPRGSAGRGLGRGDQRELSSAPPAGARSRCWRRCAATFRWSCTASRSPSGRSIRSMSACSAAVRELADRVTAGVRLGPTSAGAATPAGTFTTWLPLPYTEEALAHVVSAREAVQEVLGRQIPSSRTSQATSNTPRPP